MILHYIHNRKSPGYRNILIFLVTVARTVAYCDTHHVNTELSNHFARRSLESAVCDDIKLISLLAHHEKQETIFYLTNSNME